MIASLALAALLSSASLPTGSFANCVVQLDTTTIQQQLFANFNDAENVCGTLLETVNDDNASCTIRQKVVNGQRKFFPDFQIHEQIQANSGKDAAAQLNDFFQQGTNLFANAGIQTLLTNNGNCK